MQNACPLRELNQLRQITGSDNEAKPMLKSTQRPSGDSIVHTEDVRAAYKFILGREPENEEVLAYHAQRAQSLEDLRQTFLHSFEFQSRLPPSSPLRPLSWPPIEVEVDANGPQLRAMIKHIEANWTRIGLCEPHWSVCTAEAFKTANISQTENAFYDSGKDGMERLQWTAERCGIDLRKFTRCFELGCGVGRTTIWLATLFDRVIAADISSPHLALAQKALDRFQRSGVDLVHLNSFDAVAALSDFDVFVSLIVLQHNPPPLIAYLLKTVFNKLRAGGIGYFQVPVYSPNYHFRVDEYLSNASPTSGMEMHLIPQHRLFEILEESRCRVLEVREDAWTGDHNTISNSVLVVKQQEPV